MSQCGNYHTIILHNPPQEGSQGSNTVYRINNSRMPHHSCLHDQNYISEKGEVIGKYDKNTHLIEESYYSTPTNRIYNVYKAAAYPVRASPSTCWSCPKSVALPGTNMCSSVYTKNTCNSSFDQVSGKCCSWNEIYGQCDDGDGPGCLHPVCSLKNCLKEITIAFALVVPPTLNVMITSKVGDSDWPVLGNYPKTRLLFQDENNYASLTHIISGTVYYSLNKPVITWDSKQGPMSHVPLQFLIFELSPGTLPEYKLDLYVNCSTCTKTKQRTFTADLSKPEGEHIWYIFPDGGGGKNKSASPLAGGVGFEVAVNAHDRTIMTLTMENPKPGSA